MKKINGFTLAEVMIVLTVIGVMTAILLPVARQSMPDRNLMKFKKAYNTLAIAIRELTTSDKYYKDGDLGRYPNGDLIDGSREADYTYFCNTLADVLNVKKVNCKKHGQTDAYIAASLELESTNNFNDYACPVLMNNACSNGVLSKNIGTIITLDGVTFYEVNPMATFGMLHGENNQYRMFSFENIQNALTDPVNNATNYKLFCIDIDHPCKGEGPFQVGIRVDGKIILSQRGREWLERDVNED